MQASSKPAKPSQVAPGANSQNSSLQNSNALREEIRPLVELYSVSAGALDKAFEEALAEVGRRNEDERARRGTALSSLGNRALQTVRYK